jgi:hypothetical protein
MPEAAAPNDALKNLLVRIVSYCVLSERLTQTWEERAYRVFVYARRVAGGLGGIGVSHPLLAYMATGDTKVNLYAAPSWSAVTVLTWVALALWFLLSLWVGKSEVEHDFVLTSKCQKEFSKIKLGLQSALDSSDPEPALRHLIGQIAGIVDRHDSGTSRDVAMCWDLTRSDIVDDVERRARAYVNTFGDRWGSVPSIQQREAA